MQDWHKNKMGCNLWIPNAILLSEFPNIYSLCLKIPLNKNAAFLVSQTADG